MKATTIIAAAALAGSVAATPVAWTKVSPRSEMAARMAENSHLASRAITNDAAKFVSKQYDYVVVGAGTAGLALAARLSENGKYKVGVLEAGGSGYGVGIIDTPGQFGADLGTQYDWNYTTVANPANGVPSSGWPVAASSAAPRRSTSSSGTAPPATRSTPGSSSATPAGTGTTSTRP